MDYDEQTGDYTLSSGRKFSCVTGVIGLSPDGVVEIGGDMPPMKDWTSADYAELADEMIERWQALKESTSLITADRKAAAT